MSQTIKPVPWYRSLQGLIAILAVAGTLVFLILSIAGLKGHTANIPLYVVFVFGGVPLCWQLAKRIRQGDFGSDLLAGISIVTSILLQEYLAGTFVILMLAGGEAIEAYALRKASSILDALASRMPNLARRIVDGKSTVLPISEIKLGDQLEILPHDICPVDGVVVDGHGTMDEAFLTGEPYQTPKAPGSKVLSGAINGEALLVIQASALADDSRYQKIAKIIGLEASKKVPMRRLGDLLGTWYTPIALGIATISWVLSADPLRFLAVLVVATPCPLLIAIPVAIISAISVLAKQGIIVKNPAALEWVTKCKTIILDKTGTLTYGKPKLVELEVLGAGDKDLLLRQSASLEQYSKHPLAEAVIQAAREHALSLLPISSVSEKPGEGLTGLSGELQLAIVGRKQVIATGGTLPSQKEGLECILLVNGTAAAILHFRDSPRTESRGFVRHLGRYHQVSKVMIMSGDRDAEVQHLAQIVGIADIQGGMSPEEKLVRVKEETGKSPTLYIGDGINDAPSLQAATVGIALGTKSDITSEAADIVILEPSLEKVDEFFHLSRRMRTIALQSALGGMALSIVAMVGASAGLITPLAGAIGQEVIDVLAVLNALRVSVGYSSDRHDLKKM